MAGRRVKILPVTEEDNLHGVITRMDILVLHVLRPQRG
jgi:CBS domain-containing protein